MRQDIQIEILNRVFEMSREDQADVLSYIDHVSRIRRTSRETERHDRALQEIRQALNTNSSF